MTTAGEDLATAQPRWLDEREQRAWRAFVRMRHGLDVAIDRQLTRDAGMSAADYALLVPLSESPERRLRARDLGMAVGWDRSRLSHQVRRMEARGLISRQLCPTDARGTFVQITPSGLTAMTAAAAGHVTFVREHLFDLLSDGEVDTLTAISERVLERLTQEAAGPDCTQQSGAC